MANRRRWTALHAPALMAGRGRWTIPAPDLMANRRRWAALHAPALMARRGRWTAVHAPSLMANCRRWTAIHAARVMTRCWRWTAIHATTLMTRCWRRGPAVHRRWPRVLIVAATLTVVPVAALVDMAPADHHVAGPHIDEAGTRWRPIPIHPVPIGSRPIPIALDPSVAGTRSRRCVLHRRRRWLAGYIELRVGVHVGRRRRRGRRRGRHLLITRPYRNGHAHGGRETAGASQSDENRHPSYGALHIVLLMYDLRG